MLLLSVSNRVAKLHLARKGGASSVNVESHKRKSGVKD